MKLLAKLLTFFASLFGIKRSRMLTIEMMNMAPHCDDDDVTQSDDVGPDERSTDIEWAVIQLNSVTSTKSRTTKCSMAQ